MPSERQPSLVAASAHSGHVHPVLSDLQNLIREDLLAEMPAGSEAGFRALAFDQLVHVYLSPPGRVTHAFARGLR